MITADFKNVTRNLIYIFKTYGKKNDSMKAILFSFETKGPTRSTLLKEA